MTCSSTRKQLVLYLAHELSDREAERVARHLDRCSRCSREAVTLDETQDRLEQVLQTDREPSAALDARVLEAVRGLAPARRRSTMRRTLALSCALMCAALVAWTIGRRTLVGSERRPLDGPLLEAAYRASIARDEPVWPPHSVGSLTRNLTREARFPVRVVVDEDTGARLMQGHTLAQGRTTLAALRYEWKGRPLILFQADADRTNPPQARFARYKGETYRLGAWKGVGFVAWKSGRANCVLMAQASPEEILPLAGEFCEAMDRS